MYSTSNSSLYLVSILPLQAKSVLNEPSERKRYDLWLDSGIAMTFRQWQGLKDAVHTSMHWATPKLAGRMLSNGEKPSAKEDDELSEEELPAHLQRIEEAERGEPLPDEEEEQTDERAESGGEGKEARAEDPAADAVEEEEDDDEILYPPTNVTELGLRVASPDPEWGWDRPEEELRAERLKHCAAVREEDRGKDDGLPKINEVRIG